MNGISLAAISIGLAFGQMSDSSLSFEVASIKPCPPIGTRQSASRQMGCFGGPGTRSPGQYICTDATVAIMVQQAFDLKEYQLPGVSRMDGPSYDVLARIPAGAKQEQIRIMLRNLLVERFKLAYHFEKRKMPGYELGVAKDGPKLKVSLPEPSSPVDAGSTASMSGRPGKLVMGPYGMWVAPMSLPPGGHIQITGRNGVKQYSARAATMDQIVDYLSREVERPVTDATGFTEKFDFTLTFTGEISSEGEAPRLVTAVQEQLGLRLSPKRSIVVDVFVIDHVARNPTAN